MSILNLQSRWPPRVELFKSQAYWNVIVSNPKEYPRHLADAG
jgi:hypothetical protein